jgi:hypothetical protein
VGHTRIYILTSAFMTNPTHRNSLPTKYEIDTSCSIYLC